MKPVIAVVGAFDRFNFGDLLFPIVVQQTLSGMGVEADYRFYSIRGSDLRERGGVKTRPITELREGHPRARLVVLAGGELLSARWSDAYSGLAGPRRTLAVKILAKFVGAGPVDGLCRRLLSGDRPQPWVLDAVDLGLDAPVTCNGVGGIGLGSLPESFRDAARTRLARAGYLGVRDTETKSALEELNLPLDIHLTPDPAVLISEIFPRDEAFSAASPETRDLLSGMREQYFVFQVGRYPSWGVTEDLADQIRKIHDRAGLSCLLLPLGQAPGHEDQGPLRRIAKLLDDLPVTLLPSPDVTDILAAIAGARLVVGSSLHANQTALVYGVPHVGFGSRVRKLDLMLKTWDPTNPEGATPIDSIADRAVDVLEVDRAVLTDHALALQTQARTALEQQARLLD